MEFKSKLLLDKVSFLTLLFIRPKTLINSLVVSLPKENFCLPFGWIIDTVLDFHIDLKKLGRYQDA